MTQLVANKIYEDVCHHPPWKCYFFTLFFLISSFHLLFNITHHLIYFTSSHFTYISFAHTHESLLACENSNLSLLLKIESQVCELLVVNWSHLISFGKLLRLISWLFLLAAALTIYICVNVEKIPFYRLIFWVSQLEGKKVIFKFLLELNTPHSILQDFNKITLNLNLKAFNIDLRHTAIENSKHRLE